MMRYRLLSVVLVGSLLPVLAGVARSDREHDRPRVVPFEMLPSNHMVVRDD